MQIIFSLQYLWYKHECPIWCHFFCFWFWCHCLPVTITYIWIVFLFLLPLFFIKKILCPSCVCLKQLFLNIILKLEGLWICFHSCFAMFIFICEDFTQTCYCKETKYSRVKSTKGGGRVFTFPVSPVNCSSRRLGASQRSSLPGDCPFLLGWATCNLFSLILEQSHLLTENTWIFSQRRDSKVCQWGECRHGRGENLSSCSRDSLYTCFSTKR